MFVNLVVLDAKMVKQLLIRSYLNIYELTESVQFAFRTILGGIPARLVLFPISVPIPDQKSRGDEENKEHQCIVIGNVPDEIRASFCRHERSHRDNAQTEQLDAEGYQEGFVDPSDDRC